jgi:hypothetical protein
MNDQTGYSMYSDRDDFSWMVELIDSPVGEVRKIKTVLERQDILGAVRVRLGIGRDNYMVSPGLYAVGSPDDKSHVLVTANYKLTFDALRSKLAGQNLWILVLDTKGINVWCAAGKGTFGTEELIQRISLVQLSKVVSHKTLILPQLGAPGVSAYNVTKNTGFKVVYGPVKADDISQFLADNLKATEKMRKVEFNLKDRLLVIPIELYHSLKFIPVIFVLLLVINLINPGGVRFGEALLSSFFNLIPYLVSIAVGTIGIAALLPYIPFRSFALKGLLLGLIWAAVVIKYSSAFHFPGHTLILAAHSLFLTSVSTFLALNFTGSTTYTSLSGVKIETLYTIPVVILASVIGLGLVVTYKILLFIG